MGRLAGKTAFISGAAQGIGLACARLFAREGANIALIDIDADGGQEAATSIAADTGTNTLFIKADVSNSADMEAAATQCYTVLGGLDIAIANAATIKSGDILDLDEADFDTVMAVNLKGVFLQGQAVARVMRDKGIAGSIINMTSVNGIMAIADQVAYNTAKGGVNQLTRAMALGLVQHDIRVNAVAPGSINTELLKKVMVDDKVKKKILGRTPMGRAGDPAEVAKTCLFLASDDSSYITGEIIVVDGGRMALNYSVDVPD